jgi:glutamate-1-semialdehyde 2,1-aminomutase
MAAGAATLKELKKPGFYEALDAKAATFATELSALTKKYQIPATLNRAGSVMTAFFTEGPVTDFESAMTADTDAFGLYYRGMLEQGIYLAPTQFEGALISAAHKDEELAKTLEAAESVFSKLKGK